MRIFRDYEGAFERWAGGAVALGNFDGVHRGHQAVIRDAARAAAASGTPLGVVCFEPHPRSLFRPDGPKFRLTSPRTKARLMSALGADVLFMLRFTLALARMEGREFVRRVLVDGLRASHVTVGYDFRFGRDRVDDLRSLEAMGAEFGFGVSAVGPIKDSTDSQPFSSTQARDHLRQGRPRQAADLLGHWWTVEGHVRAGDRRGRTIGFPTINVPLGRLMEPRLGVYAVRVAVGSAIYDGVANIGRRPTFDKHDVLLEAHLFDFAGDLYGRSVCVALVEFIRPERKFDGLDSLKAQIAADSEAARRLLADPRNQAAPFDGVAALAPAPATGA
jgi:riboflavin kinase/FMN adenylyltransferase